MNVNCAHLESYDPSLYRQLVCYPQEVIPTFDMAVNEMFFERYPAAVLDHQIQVRPFNAQKTKNMRSLNPEGGFPYMFLQHQASHDDCFTAEVPA